MIQKIERLLYNSREVDFYRYFHGMFRANETIEITDNPDVERWLCHGF